MYRLSFVILALAIYLCWSASICAGEKYTESAPLQPELEIYENSVTHVMPFEDRNAIRVWTSALPTGKEKKFFAKGDFALTQFDKLTFQISLSKNENISGDEKYELITYFKDVDFWWYQKLLPYELRRGDINEIVVPLHDGSNNTLNKYRWKPVGHMKPLDKSAFRKVREFGIIIFPSRSLIGSTRTAENNLREPIDGGHELPGEFEVSEFMLTKHDGEEELSIYDFSAPAACGTYDCFEVSFSLNRTYENPFNPDEIDISAEFTSPTGRKHSVNGFWFQDYQRNQKGRMEVLRPVDKPMWKIRFAPVETGEYLYKIAVKDAEGSLTTKPHTFTASQSKSNGFVRVSKQDHNYFEFDNGQFFWPIALNLHCTYDYRYARMVRNDEIPIEDRRSYFYDERLGKMAAAGMNATEIWIASWGFEIEWRGDWNGWAGLGHYSLQNAWRLDHVTKMAEELGIYINLVMSCHGAYCYGTNNTTGDSEWQNSPWYTGNGGWIEAEDVATTMTDERVFDSIEKRARYIVARYAHSPSIWCWEVMSESDLVPLTTSDAQHRFILRYASYIKNLDPYNHPMTNHYCGSYLNYDEKMFNHPLMDVASGDAYRGGVSKKSNVVRYESFPKHIIKAADHLQKFNKPAVVNECGGTWSAAPRSLLEADIHALNWATFMTSIGGTPQTWWEDLVNENHLYDHYAAFAKYQQGEDKRARNFETHDDKINGPDGKPIRDLFALSLRNDKCAYVWIYDDREFSYGPLTLQSRKDVYYQCFNLPKLNETRTFSGVIYPLAELAEGKYTVEIWDTYKGEVIEMREIETADGTLQITLPEFKKDIALKIKNVLY